MSVIQSAAKNLCKKEIFWTKVLKMTDIKNNLLCIKPVGWAFLPNRITSPVMLPQFSQIRRAAFTLAEVLITLGVIGVVAALTMPTLIARWQEKTWLNQFISTYSILSQAYLSAYNDYGLPIDWELGGGYTPENNAKAASIYFKYLKLANDFGANSRDETENLPRIYKGLDGNKAMTNANGWDLVTYVTVLSNGAIVSLREVYYVEALNSFVIRLSVDINGLKGPNQFGKDFFILCLNSKNNYPVITGPDYAWLSERFCSTNHDADLPWYSGGSCATWIIKHGNMDYLHRELTHDEWIK